VREMMRATCIAPHAAARLLLLLLQYCFLLIE
jgi:hypothetical protein